MYSEKHLKRKTKKSAIMPVIKKSLSFCAVQVSRPSNFPPFQRIAASVWRSLKRWTEDKLNFSSRSEWVTDSLTPGNTSNIFYYISSSELKRAKRIAAGQQMNKANNTRDDRSIIMAHLPFQDQQSANSVKKQMKFLSAKI